MPTRYPSAIGLWFVLLLVAPPVALIALGIALTAAGHSAGAVILAIGAFTGTIMLLLTLPCHYTLTDEALKIRCGALYHATIALAEIDGAEPSRNLLAAPALSLRRIQLKVRGRRVPCLISPRDREGFLSDLHARQARRAAGRS